MQTNSSTRQHRTSDDDNLPFHFLHQCAYIKANYQNSRVRLIQLVFAQLKFYCFVVLLSNLFRIGNVDDLSLLLRWVTTFTRTKNSIIAFLISLVVYIIAGSWDILTAVSTLFFTVSGINSHVVKVIEFQMSRLPYVQDAVLSRSEYLNLEHEHSTKLTLVIFAGFLLASVILNANAWLLNKKRVNPHHESRVHLFSDTSIPFLSLLNSFVAFIYGLLFDPFFYTFLLLSETIKYRERPWSQYVHMKSQQMLR